MARKDVIPTNDEKVLGENDFIVSKTDTKGKLTYCNQIFIDMAEFTEEELLGTNHNIIRHPDMPKIAFKVAWDLIQSGKEFFGFVKNLRKSGGFYWVFANITPDYDQNGNIVGYTSVRRKPPKEAINTIEPIYKELVRLEQSGGMTQSEQYLMNFLNEQGITYDELVLSLQGVK